MAADFAEACLAFAETTSSCLCRLLANENLCQFVAPSKPSRSSLSLSARWRFGAFRTGSSFQHGVYIAPWTSHCKREMQPMRTRSTRDQVQTRRKGWADEHEARQRWETESYKRQSGSARLAQEGILSFLSPLWLSGLEEVVPRPVDWGYQCLRIWEERNQELWPGLRLESVASEASEWGYGHNVDSILSRSFGRKSQVRGHPARL